MFQQMHTTADGQKMLIAQMKDSHLLNMIQMIIRRTEKMTDEFQVIVDASERSKTDAAFDGHARTEAQRKIYGIPAPPDLEETTTQYAQAVAKASLFIEPYLLEAWTRKFAGDDEETFVSLRIRWQQAVGRNEALPNPRGMIAIAAQVRPTSSIFVTSAFGIESPIVTNDDDYDDELKQNWQVAAKAA